MKNDKNTIVDDFLVYYIKNTEKKVIRRLELLKKDRLEKLLDRVLIDLSKGLEISGDTLDYREKEYSFSREEFYTLSDILEIGGKNFIIEGSTYFYTEEYPFEYKEKLYSLYIMHGQGTYMSIREFSKEECHIDGTPRRLGQIKAVAKRECINQLEDVERLKKSEKTEPAEEKKKEIELGKVFIVDDERFILIESKRDFAYILLKESHIKGCFLIEEEYVGNTVTENVAIEMVLDYL